MELLYLNDILNRLTIEIPDLKLNRVKLFRHSLNSTPFKLCYERELMNEYQQLQSKGFFAKCDYVLSFISGPSTSAKFIGLYKVVDSVGHKATSNVLGEGFNPLNICEDDTVFEFKLMKLEIMSQFENRLIINWGKAAKSWHQWATNDKEIIAIHENEKYAFKGYEGLVLDYLSLKKIVSDNILFENWHSALESVYAIYLIIDQESGKQYVGSAYGEGGLLQRWKHYVLSKHGGNKLMINLLKEYPDRYKSFQFSILQIIPKTYTSEDVIALENLYKEKLKTRKFGLNDN